MRSRSGRRRVLLLLLILGGPRRQILGGKVCLPKRSYPKRVILFFAFPEVLFLFGFLVRFLVVLRPGFECRDMRSASVSVSVTSARRPSSSSARARRTRLKVGSFGFRFERES